MKRSILFFILLFSISFHSCNDVKEKKQNKYLNIPGTRLSIIPPNGFKISKSIVGLEKENESMIQVMDLIGGNYDSNTNTFTKSEFENKGIKVLDFKEIKIDNYNAKYAHLKGNEKEEYINLVFGDSTFSVMVMAISNSSDKTLLTEIKDALLKIKYDKEIIIDALATSFFEIDSNDSKFKFAKSSANMFIYSENGIVKESYNNEPMVMISTLPNDFSTTKEMMTESIINGLLQNGFSLKEERKPVIGKINGYESIETEYIAESKGMEKLVYLTVLINDDKAISFYGITGTDFEQNLIEFKKISHNLRFK
ncbi:hypothetical protein LXD69_12940 [Flavobacterium sediminilitoris]|uniref:Beta-lactamase class A n=1 Tax=Flavobacterium sediminilitoris TaxID=2024526 RepID=A0ABY4HJB9_9FLAO|nr:MULTISPECIES: hypothetical protein [Flavobacterium]UOX32940.1 hypothetical protein LXD69_12940 [Flavobacterium sediminilitoris]